MSDWLNVIGIKNIIHDYLSHVEDEDLYISIIPYTAWQNHGGPVRWHVISPAMVIYFLTFPQVQNVCSLYICFYVRSVQSLICYAAENNYNFCINPITNS